MTTPSSLQLAKSKTSEDRPTIAFLLNSLEFGGAQRVFVDDANDFVRQGYDVVFFVLYGDIGTYPLAKELDSRATLVFLKVRGPFDFGVARACARDLRRHNNTYLFSTLNDGNIFARWVALKTGRRLRLIQREANSLSSKTTWQKVLDKLLQWIPYRIIVLSMEAKRSLEKLLPFSRKKIVLLPNAVSIPASAHDGTENTSPLILSVGRLTHQKNHELFISALGEIARAGISFNAVIVGEGELRGELEKQAEKEKITDRITFTGHLLHEAVLEIYKKAGIFVSSSLWEGSSNVILEAMSFGIPVIATDVGSASDVIVDKQEGLLIPSKQTASLVQAIKILLTNKEFRDSLGAAARKKIEARFSRETRFNSLRAIIGQP